MNVSFSYKVLKKKENELYQYVRHIRNSSTERTKTRDILAYPNYMNRKGLTGEKIGLLQIK